MDVLEERAGETIILGPKGRLDSNSSKSFEDQVMALIDGGKAAMLIDFSGLDYVSSAGLRVLLMAAKKSKAGQGRLALCALSEPIREVFDMSGFAKLFAIFPSRGEAMAHFG